MTASAPEATAFANRSGRSPGTYSQVSSIRPPRLRAAARSSSAVSAERAEHLVGVLAVPPAGVPDLAPASRTSGTARSASAPRPGPRRALRTAVPSAAYCGSARMSRTSYTGATAACASSNAATTSSRVALPPPRRRPRRPARRRARPGPLPVAEPRLVDQLRPADQPHHPLGDALRAGGHRHPPPVGAPVRVARRVVRRAVAQPGLDVAELVVPGDLRAEHRHDGLDDGQVDDLARRRCAPAPRRASITRVRRGERGDRVGQPERGQRRRAVRLTGAGGEPAHRLGERAEAGPPGVRADLAEPGDPGDHQPRVDRVQLGRPEPPALQRARPEVLDQHVGVGEQPAQDRGAVRVGQVEGDARACCGRAPSTTARRRPWPGRARGPGRAGRVLDLDHVGAEVAEERRGERPGEQRGRPRPP